MTELDFTIEFNSQSLNDRAEAEMFDQADSFLRELADGHSDMTGAAINVRPPSVAETPIYEVTVVVYTRPEHIAATKKDVEPIVALNDSLNAVERQVRKKREKLRERWQQPGNDPVATEIEEIMAADSIKGVDSIEGADSIGDASSIED